MFPPRRFSGFSCPGHGRLGVGDYFLLKSANPSGSGGISISASFPIFLSAVPEFNSEMTGRLFRGFCQVFPPIVPWRGNHRLAAWLSPRARGKTTAGAISPCRWPLRSVANKFEGEALSSGQETDPTENKCFCAGHYPEVCAVLTAQASRGGSTCCVRCGSMELMTTRTIMVPMRNSVLRSAGEPSSRDIAAQTSA